jgi:hypothetical protein
MRDSNNQIRKKTVKFNELKSSALTDNKPNLHISFKNLPKFNNQVSSDYTKRNNTKKNTFRLTKKKSSEVNYLDNDINEKGNFESDNYEDLFFYFLLHMEKIEYFENLILHKKERRINNNYYFLNILESLSGNKIHWNQFYFSKYAYILFYIKSRILQKEIIKYSISKGKEIMEVINSYNKKYTSSIKMKNWLIKPQEAYQNYEKINQSKKSEIEKSNKKTLSKINNFTDFVIRTNNRGKGKTLIFLGKTINIYIDDNEKYQNQNNGLSMATEDSEFNTKVKNEIIYTFDNATLKSKKGNSFINNRINKIKISKNNWNSINNTKYKKLNKTLRNININKTRFKYKDKFINKNNFKKSLLNDYVKNSKKLPLIKLTKKKSLENTELLDSKIRERNMTFLSNEKIKNSTPKVNRIINKFSFNYNNNFEFDEKKNNRTIINFFSKKDNDFYY